MNSADRFIEIKGIDVARELIEAALDSEKSVFTWTRQFEIDGMNMNQTLQIHVKDLKQAVAAHDEKDNQL